MPPKKNTDTATTETTAEEKRIAELEAKAAQLERENEEIRENLREAEAAKTAATGGKRGAALDDEALQADIARRQKAGLPAEDARRAATAQREHDRRLAARN